MEDDLLGDLFDDDLFDTLLSGPSHPHPPAQPGPFHPQQHLQAHPPAPQRALPVPAPSVAPPQLPSFVASHGYYPQQLQQQQAAGFEGNPALGLRVLLVDDDAVVLRVLEQMLRMCQYSVTSCTSGTSAVALLRSHPDGFDLVLCDVMMPDMDGFKLLEIVGLEMDLPVIMISGNGDTETVLRGVTHGAVDFLIKPVRIEELRNMWQHVMRRRLEGEPLGMDSSDEDLSMDEEDPALGTSPMEGPDPLAMAMDTSALPLAPPAQLAPQLPDYPPPPPMIQSAQLRTEHPQQQQQQQQQQLHRQVQQPRPQHQPPPPPPPPQLKEPSQMPIAPPPPPPHAASKKPSKGAKSSKASHKKRKDSEGVEEGSVSKKPRVIWSMDMHQQFVNAVNQLGVDKAVPRKILDLMDIGGLTRENVASHLQKYRLYLKKVDAHPDEQFTH